MVATLFKAFKDRATESSFSAPIASEKVLLDELFGKPLLGHGIKPVLYVPLEVHFDKPEVSPQKTPRRPDENDKAKFHQYMMENLLLG